MACSNPIPDFSGPGASPQTEAQEVYLQVSCTVPVFTPRATAFPPRHRSRGRTSGASTGEAPKDPQGLLRAESLYQYLLMKVIGDTVKDQLCNFPVSSRAF